MRIPAAFLAVLSILWIGACRPSEPAGPQVTTQVTDVHSPVESAATEPAAETPEPKTAGTRTWNFEDAEVGGLPAGWSAAMTGEGPGSEWKVLDDESAPAGSRVLGQVSSEGPKPVFCLCVADDTDYADLDLSVVLKAVKGNIDQGGGPVWRWQDANNYYIARMNPLEFNFRLYKVIDGKRTQLATADVEIPDEDVDADDPLLNRWHTLRVVHRGNRIQCYLNGELRLEAEDDSIQKAGKVGMWAKADAVTSFDNLSVAP